jgi:hypothetical protein
MEPDVNASQETKVGPSVVTETLRSLSEQAKICREKIDLAEAGQSFNRADVLAEVSKLLDACQNLRDAILSEDSAATWTTKNELSTLVRRLDDVAAKRRRYLDLAEVLATGTITHRRERTRLERLSLRDKAVAELMEISEQPAPPELPGPVAENWLEWACSLEDDTNEIELHKLKNGFPRLDDFVRQLEIDWWHDGPAPEKAEKRKSAASPAPVSINGSHSNGHRNGASTQPAVEEVFASTPAPEAPAGEVSAPLVETFVESVPAFEAAPAVETPAEVEPAPIVFSYDTQFDAPVLNTDFIEAGTTEEPVELPLESLLPNRQGVISFFPWEQIDQFARRIETADVVRKDARTIRALLAVSHWLDPRDQNPMTHSKCGIRALTGYPATTEPTYVSPSDVMQFIAQDDGLPLLTGGADLLRWGLLQPSERNFQGVAAVHRFTPDHLKAWFSDIFRIALSDKQIDDIYNLTSGIPYLIGQLHKLIIPMPDDPPTWLGLARWMDIKAQFEKLIPEFAHDLKKGPAAVRLTDRELSLLNMVITVSADSTPENIVANLSENWEKYQHPEYRAMSSRDEVSLAVLLELGLLPRRNVTGGVPSQALLPVKQDDAIRKLAEHL